MRLAFVIFGDLTDRSGGYRYDMELRNALCDAGHDVVIISQNDGLPYGSQFHLAREHEWQDRLLQASPDVVLFDELNHAATAAALPPLRQKLRNVPFVAIVHHLRSDEAPFCLRARLAERAFLRGCDGWICNTSVTLRRVRSISGVRRSSAVIFPGRNRTVPMESVATENADVTTPAGTESTTGTGSTEGADSTEGTCRVLFVGNVIPRKNIHRLIRGVLALPRCHLDIFGEDTVDPVYTARLHRIVRRVSKGPDESRVFFHGRVSRRDLEEAYGKADVLAVPSLYEGFGMVYLEALERGVPVIATRRGGATEIVTHSDIGRLVLPNRQRELIQALRAYCHSSRERNETVSVATRLRAAAFPEWNETMAGAIRFIEMQYKNHRFSP